MRTMLVAATQVDGVGQAEALQRARGEAGAVARRLSSSKRLIADPSASSMTRRYGTSRHRATGVLPAPQPRLPTTTRGGVRQSGVGQKPGPRLVGPRTAGDSPTVRRPRLRVVETWVHTLHLMSAGASISGGHPISYTAPNSTLRAPGGRLSIDAPGSRSCPRGSWIRPLERGDPGAPTPSYPLARHVPSLGP
jgi:hypothetical protein